MHISKGQSEQGIIVGNSYDKYGSWNPIARLLMLEFQRKLEMLVSRTGAMEIHEVGCGEGYWVLRWLEEGRRARGSDFSGKVINLAKKNAEERGLPACFKIASIYELSPIEDAAELVVCCEVLEHLEQPRSALDALSNLAKPYLILSVPWEPMWSIMNMLRGRYLNHLGNTPGHVQKWSKRSLYQLLNHYFDRIEMHSSLPWNLALCRVKEHA